MGVKTLEADLEDTGVTILQTSVHSRGVDIVCEGTDVWEEYSPQTDHEYTLDYEYLTGEKVIMYLVNRN